MFAMSGEVLPQTLAILVRNGNNRKWVGLGGILKLIQLLDLSALPLVKISIEI